MICTRGTAQFLRDNGIDVKDVYKVREGRPNIVDSIANGEISFVINTPTGKGARVDDFYIRQTALKHKVLCLTTLQAAEMLTKGLESLLKDQLKVKTIQEFHKENG
jgi:carbamoyl-phosphate synthase large subunit